MTDTINDLPPFFEKVHDKTSLITLLSKVVHHFWWTIIIEQMFSLESYETLYNFDIESEERWKYLAGKFFDDLISPPPLDDHDRFQFFFMKFIQNITTAMGMNDEDFIVFCSTILQYNETDLKSIGKWVSTHIEDLKETYLDNLTVSECNILSFESMIKKRVETLSQKSIEKTPFQKFHAKIYLDIVNYYRNYNYY